MSVTSSLGSASSVKRNLIGCSLAYAKATANQIAFGRRGGAKAVCQLVRS